MKNSTYEKTGSKEGGSSMEVKKEWEGKHYAFFCNRECEYFPCHPTADPTHFNCLFCYCPLYVLGDRCGGNPSWLPDGTKDCSACLFPHRPENYGAVVGRYGDIRELMLRE